MQLLEGAVGVLLRLMQIGALTLAETNELLDLLIKHGYRSPVSRIDDL